MESFAGQATFSGCIALALWKTAEVAALLPPELTRAADAPGGRLHPVVFVFGEQADATLLFGGLTLPLGASYRELGIAIPFVRHRAGGATHIYILRMYANYLPAIWSGNVHYGFSKELASLSWDGPVFRVAGTDGAPLLTAEVTREGPWSPARGGGPAAFAAVRALFAQPVLGRLVDGTYLGSRFHWDVSEAEVRPCRAGMALEAPLLPGSAARRLRATARESCVVRRLLWKISWPATCDFAMGPARVHRPRRSRPNARMRL